MPDSAQTTGSSGGQHPEQQSVLGFPVRPEGDGGAVAGGRHHWYELAQEVHGAFADIDRAIASMQWSGDGRRAFDAAWSQLSGHGTEAAQHSQEMGDHLLTLGHQIDDAQHQWDMAMAAMAASTAIGVGLTFVTFGISDAVAEGAAAAAVGTMEAVCAALDISLEAAIQVMITAIRIGVQLAVKFTWQFGISVVTQESANVVQGQGLDHVNLLQAAEFAAAATVIPGVAGKMTIGGKQVLQGASGAFVSGALTDTTIQSMEAVTEGKPFSPGEVVASGALAVGGQVLGGAIGTGPRGRGTGPGRSLVADSGDRLPQLYVAPGVELTPSERVAAQYWLDGDHDVRVPRPAGSQGIRNVRTADLDVRGVGHVDVYAPGPSTRANGIVSAILNKNSQATVVHVEIDATSVSESELLRSRTGSSGTPQQAVISCAS
jgi:hypothetical protein